MTPRTSIIREIKTRLVGSSSTTRTWVPVGSALRSASGGASDSTPSTAAVRAASLIGTDQTPVASSGIRKGSTAASTTVRPAPGADTGTSGLIRTVTSAPSGTTSAPARAKDSSRAATASSGPSTLTRCPCNGPAELGVPGAATNGSRRTNVEPEGPVAATRSDPPMTSASLEAIASPRPAPAATRPCRSVPRTNARKTSSGG